MSEYKKCEVCGETKPVGEFSKSYPRRCKECVAQHMREVRRAARQQDDGGNELNLSRHKLLQDVRRKLIDALNDIDYLIKNE